MGDGQCQGEGASHMLATSFTPSYIESEREKDATTANTLHHATLDNMELNKLDMTLEDLAKDRKSERGGQRRRRGGGSDRKSVGSGGAGRGRQQKQQSATAAPVLPIGKLLISNLHFKVTENDLKVQRVCKWQRRRAMECVMHDALWNALWNARCSLLALDHSSRNAMHILNRCRSHLCPTSIIYRSSSRRSARCAKSLSLMT